MPRLIDADALLEILRKDATEKLRFFDPKYEGYLTAMAKVEEIVEDILPTIDPVVRGRWIKLYHGNYKCSECGDWWGNDDNEMVEDFNYCPNCGALMREDGEEE